MRERQQKEEGDGVKSDLKGENFRNRGFQIKVGIGVTHSYSALGEVTLKLKLRLIRLINISVAW